MLKHTHTHKLSIVKEKRHINLCHKDQKYLRVVGPAYKFEKWGWMKTKQTGTRKRSEERSRRRRRRRFNSTLHHLLLLLLLLFLPLHPINSLKFYPLRFTIVLLFFFILSLFFLFLSLFLHMSRVHDINCDWCSLGRKWEVKKNEVQVKRRKEPTSFFSSTRCLCMVSSFLPRCLRSTIYLCVCMCLCLLNVTTDTGRKLNKRGGEKYEPKWRFYPFYSLTMRMCKRVRVRGSVENFLHVSLTTRNWRRNFFPLLYIYINALTNLFPSHLKDSLFLYPTFPTRCKVRWVHFVYVCVQLAQPQDRSLEPLTK